MPTRWRPGQKCKRFRLPCACAGDYTRIPLRTYKQQRITANRPADRWEPHPAGGWTLMAADGPRYKALGNTWSIPPVRWIGQRIQAVEAIHHQLKAAA
ncbi:MAG TPA: hypothetical protein VEA40_00520 [Ramlibacter sp.]|nr:hypothetical protein [Ramlibacter sp.]